MRAFISILFILLHFLLQSQIINSNLDKENYIQTIQNLKNQAQSFESNLKLGDIYQETGNYAKAIKHYLKALSYKNDKHAYLKLAKSYLKNNQRNKAIEIYETILQKEPDHLLLKYHLANLYLQNKNFEKSLPILKFLSLKDSLNPNYLYKIALVYTYLNQEPNAIRFYKKTISVDSTFYQAYYRLAKIHTNKSNLFLAKKLLQKALLIKPDAINLNRLQAIVAYKTHDYPTTIKSILCLDSLKQNNPFYKNLLGIAYFYNHKYHKAENIFNELINQKNELDNTYYYLGLTYKNLNKPELAEQSFKKSIKIKRPSVASEYYQIAMLYKKQQKLKEAISYLKKALHQKQTNPDILFQLALLSESYFQNKKIALNYFKNYVAQYKHIDAERSRYALQQIRKIKTELFFQAK